MLRRVAREGEEDVVEGGTVQSELVHLYPGSVEVPENWDQPAGRKLSIAVAVIPAEAAGSHNDPLVPLKLWSSCVWQFDGQ